MKLQKLVVAASSAAIVLTTAAVLLCKGCGLNPKLKQKIHLMKTETVELRFKILSDRDGSGKMLIAVKFFNLDGKEVGRFETGYKDGEIKIPYAKIDIDGHFIFLPLELETPSGKKCLQNYYFNDGYPEIYNSRLIDSVLKSELNCMFLTFKEKDAEYFEKYYGKISYGVITLPFPWERTTYGLKTNIKGEISLTND